MTRNRKISFAVATFALALGAARAARAAGDAPMQPPSSPPPMEQKSPEELARQSYNLGLKYQEKADKLAAQALSKEPQKREKAEAQARKEYEKAAKEYAAALESVPEMYQALNGQGYTLRKMGNYDAALAAYDHALRVEPSYAPAIEYRAEAYLGLNRVEEAKSAYMSLFTSDRKRADELHAAMKKWLESRRQDPQGLSPEVIDGFGKWVAEREEIAGRTAALNQPKNDRW